MTKHQKIAKKIMNYKVKSSNIHREMSDKERKDLLAKFKKELNYLNGILANDCDKLEEKHPGRVSCYRKIWRDSSLCAKIGICNSWYSQVKNGNEKRTGINYKRLMDYFEKKNVIQNKKL